MSKDVLQHIEECLAQTGGSGTGVSYYTGASKCGRRVALDAEMAAVREANESMDAANIGTVFHAIAEWHYLGNDVVFPKGASVSQIVGEGKRLWDNYCEYYGGNPRLLVSEVIGCEVQLETQQMGASILTARIDMVVRLDARSIARLVRFRPELAPELAPGIYLWDFKTTKSRDNKAQEKALYRLQFQTYPAVWNIEHPNDPCMGLIGDYIVAHKEMSDKSFYSTFTPVPDEIQLEAIKKWLAWAEKQGKEAVPNLSECVSMFGVCAYRTMGICNGL